MGIKLMVTISQILKEMDIDFKKWENAGTRKQIAVVLHWGREHGKKFKCNELCELLKLPEDVVLTVLNELIKDGLVRTDRG